LLSLIWQVLIIAGRPYEDNRILFFNELTVSMYLYVLIMITDYNDSDDTFDSLAVILLAVVVVAFVANLAIVIVNFFVFLVKSYKKLAFKLRSLGAAPGQKYADDSAVKKKLKKKSKKAPAASLDTK
jgi:hypothetical protein